MWLQGESNIQYNFSDESCIIEVLPRDGVKMGTYAPRLATHRPFLLRDPELKTNKAAVSVVKTSATIQSAI